MQNYDKIVLIDDDEITNYINENLLQDLGLGTKVVIYEAAEEALEDIRNDSEHLSTLILLDLKMPVFDGFDFLEDYNKIPASKRKNLRLVILTTSENPQDLQKLKDLGHEDVIIKPLSKDTLKQFF